MYEGEIEEQLGLKPLFLILSYIKRTCSSQGKLKDSLCFEIDPVFLLPADSRQKITYQYVSTFLSKPQFSFCHNIW